MNRGLIRILSYVTICYLVFVITPAQALNTDSLLKFVNKSSNPTKRIEALLLLSDQEVTDQKKALNYAKQAFELATKVEDDGSKLNALIRISQLSFMQSDLRNAMESALEAKSIAEKLDKKPELAILLDGLGLLYYNLGDKKKCAEFYFSSLKIAEQLDDKYLICKTLSRIGLLYNDQKDFDKAIEYFTRSQKITTELNDKEGIATNLNNIANVYLNKSDYQKALYNLNEALKITKTIDNPSLEASHFLNIGKVYFKMKNYREAMRYNTLALDIFRRLNNQTRIALCNLSISEAELAIEKYPEADKHISEALTIGKRQDSKDIIYQSYKLFHELSLVRKDTAAAFNYLLLENQWKDSLALGENKQNLARMELQYHFEKKEQLDKAEVARRNIFNTAVILLLLLGIIIILLVLNQLRLRAKKSKLEKEGLEKELDFKKKELTLNVMSLMKKTEMLTELSKKIVQFEEEAVHEETRYTLKRVGKELQKTAEEETLKEFTLRFKEVHKDFYDALLQRFPDLTPSELKLCAFLKLNMTTKEISELTGQRLNTLENARYRLRQKLGITNSEVNLVTFLAQI